jgi:hypothetical protein
VITGIIRKARSDCMDPAKGSSKIPRMQVANEILRGSICVIAVAVLAMAVPAANASEGSLSAPGWHRDGAVLAPDGAHVAYSRSDAGPPKVIIVDVDHPDRNVAVDLPPRKSYNVAADLPPSMAAADKEYKPARLIWVDSRCVLVITQSGDTCRFDTDGRCLMAASGMRNLSALRPGEILPADLGILEMQALLERKLPRRSVAILGCDEARRRVLLLARGATDAGRYFVFDRSRDLLYELGPRQRVEPAGR